VEFADDVREVDGIHEALGLRDAGAAFDLERIDERTAEQDQIAPPTIPARRTIGSATIAGHSGMTSATVVASSAPDTIWPSPPMLMTLARNAMTIPAPTNRSGVALMAVFMSAVPLPNAPSIIEVNASIGLAPSRRMMMAPMRSATITAPTGTRYAARRG
jgi:hypothetical protein